MTVYCTHIPPGVVALVFFTLGVGLMLFKCQPPGVDR